MYKTHEQKTYQTSRNKHTPTTINVNGVNFTKKAIGDIDLLDFNIKCRTMSTTELSDHFNTTYYAILNLKKAMLLKTQEETIIIR